MVFNFRKESLGKVSGIGWGFGYFGAIISLILVLYFLILPEEKIFDLAVIFYPTQNHILNNLERVGFEPTVY